MLWLDHLIFGNGRGMKSPHWDEVFYWLDGRLYTWSAGFGAQLYSCQWRRPLAGDSRKLVGRNFRAFSWERRWGRVLVAWGTRVDSAEDIAQLKRELDRI